MNRLAASLMIALTLLTLCSGAHSTVDETSGAIEVEAPLSTEGESEAADELAEGEGGVEGEGEAPLPHEINESVAPAELNAPPQQPPSQNAASAANGLLPSADISTDELTKYGLAALAGLLILCLLVIAMSSLVRGQGTGASMPGLPLGQVLGRVELAANASLHFVRIGNRVLVVGLTPASMTLITDLDAASFDILPASLHGRRAILDELHSNNNSKTDGGAVFDDREISALRGDIKRLQQYLQETSREV